MRLPSTFWRRQVFTVTAWGCGLFVALTFIAMLFYPGGTITDPATRGYSFFNNFFSELGFVYTRGSNWVAAILFFVALTLAGAGLVLFFAAFRQFFSHNPTSDRFSRLGSLFGVVSGMCFIGVALVPGDVWLDGHIQFVLWAFRTFPVAAVMYAIAIFRDPHYPKRFGGVFVLFGLLLVGYMLLLELGPDYTTPQGMVIQATGQKTIVYASIISIWIQALGARQQAEAT